MKIDFEFTTPHGLFRDALHLPDDHTFTNEEIQAMQQQRVDNWIAVVTAPPIEPDTVEIDGVTYEKIEIDGQTVLKPVVA
tara:strand:- start:1862 stop:2101 length:240 start_codon:yes stop_codon:yes gene_type:complete